VVQAPAVPQGDRARLVDLVARDLVTSAVDFGPVG
jgi:hypothetical protein